MTTTTEELVKLLLEEIRKNNDTANRIDSKISEVQKCMTTLMLKTTELDIHVKETKEELKESKEDLKESKEEIKKLDHAIRGNGTPGLKTKVELIDNEQKSQKKNIDSIQREIKKSSSEVKKESTAVKIAIIGGASSGFIAFITEIFSYFSK